MTHNNTFHDFLEFNYNLMNSHFSVTYLPPGRFRHVWLFATPPTATCQAPLFMEFFRLSFKNVSLFNWSIIASWCDTGFWCWFQLCARVYALPEEPPSHSPPSCPSRSSQSWAPVLGSRFLLAVWLTRGGVHMSGLLSPLFCPLLSLLQPQAFSLCFCLCYCSVNRLICTIVLYFTYLH